MSVESDAMPAPSSQGQIQTLAQRVRIQAKALSTQIEATSAKSQLLTTTQVKTLIQSAEKYFSARTTYEKVLFNKILQNHVSSFTNPGCEQVDYIRKSAALLHLIQKYFSADIETLKLTQLIQRRNLLRQIKGLNNGYLSGAVWLYNSPLTSFAISRLKIINPQILHASLASAKHYVGKHQYAQAQKIYQNLLLEYNQSPQAPEIKELLTRCIVDGYTYQCSIAMRKRQFKTARSYLHKIIDQYPQTSYATAAQKQLEATVPIAVNYFKKLADKHFHPYGNIGVPQKKAASYYERMYQEAAPTGLKADYALYYWARALGTEGQVEKEVQLLDLHLKKFTKSDLRSEVMYLLGFTYCNNVLRNYKEGIPLLLQVAKDFPRSKQAPEALWNASFILGWNKQYDKAILLLQRLKEGYPKSPRAQWVDMWTAKYKEAR